MAILLGTNLATWRALQFLSKFCLLSSEMTEMSDSEVLDNHVFFSNQVKLSSVTLQL